MLIISPLTLGLWDPFQMAMNSWLINGINGGDPNYLQVLGWPSTFTSQLPGFLDHVATPSRSGDRGTTHGDVGRRYWSDVGIWMPKIGGRGPTVFWATKNCGKWWSFPWNKKQKSRRFFVGFLLWSGLGWWFGFLRSPYERDCYFRVALESQTINPNHPFTMNNPRNLTAHSPWRMMLGRQLAYFQGASC